MFNQIRQAPQQRVNERYVGNERGLVKAMAEIARDSKPRTIVVTDRIFLTAPMAVTARHSGLILRGIGRGCGLFASREMESVVYIPSGETVTDLKVQDLDLGDENTEIPFLVEGSGSSFVLDNLILTGSFKAFSVTGGDNIYFRTVETSTASTNSLLSGCANSWIVGCNMGLTPVSLSAGGTFNISASSLGGLLAVSGAAGILLDGCHLFGDVDTTAGGGALISNCMQNGNSITTAGGDVTSGNKP